MAHYAFLSPENVVVEVISGRDEWEMGIDWESYYAERRGLSCKRTSYNTINGVHVKGGTPFRYTYAGPGYVFWPDVNAPEGAFLPPEA